MRRWIALSILLCMLLTGCGWMDGDYVYVEPHEAGKNTAQSGNYSANSYTQLLVVMEALVNTGTETAIIDVSRFTQNNLESSMATARKYILEVFPVGVYAVDDVAFEIGSNKGRPAIAVEISYRRSRMDIQQIRKKVNMDAVASFIESALKNHSSRVVIQVNQYVPTDFNEIVQRFARENPQLVMEVPLLSEGIYGSGISRVIELNFVYQNSKEALRQMQIQVKPVFDAAVLYVSGEGSEQQKYAQLFSFLTERFNYRVETSITPSYSLLCHGVGDSRAFAEVYASMCTRAGLDCQIVTGSRYGEPWTWNMVQDNGNYYHVDLLRSSSEGNFREYLDSEMADYVWDYSAYPACNVYFQQPATQEGTQPTESAEQPSEEPETEPFESKTPESEETQPAE